MGKNIRNIWWYKGWLLNINNWKVPTYVGGMRRMEWEGAGETERNSVWFFQ